MREKAEEILRFTGLHEKMDFLGTDITIADKKRLEVAMALGTEPTLLMLDEAMAGLTPVELREMIGLIRKVRENGVTLIIVEHVMEAVMELSDRVIVINSGRKIVEGSPKDVVGTRKSSRPTWEIATMLEIKNASVGYKGGVLAVQDISFTVNKGEVVGLIGSNGAGKSTILRAISGLLRLRAGEIHFNGEALHAVPAYDIVRRGIAMVPEGRQLFGRLSVIDNLLMGAYAIDSKQRTQETLETVLALFPRLAERKGQRADTLSGGEQQQLAIGRGLMSQPSLLMLDEPSLGIMPKLVSEIFETIHEIAKKGLTVLLVEQNVFEALHISDRAYVLQTGRIVLEGRGKELLQSDLVRQAYLGM